MVISKASIVEAVDHLMEPEGVKTLFYIVYLEIYRFFISFSY